MVKLPKNFFFILFLLHPWEQVKLWTQGYHLFLRELDLPNNSMLLYHYLPCWFKYSLNFKIDLFPFSNFFAQSNLFIVFRTTDIAWLWVFYQTLCNIFQPFLILFFNKPILNFTTKNLYPLIQHLLKIYRIFHYWFLCF